MSVKEEVLTLLEANRSEDLSGQQIADLFAGEPNGSVGKR